MEYYDVNHVTFMSPFWCVKGRVGVFLQGSYELLLSRSTTPVSGCRVLAVNLWAANVDNWLRAVR